ncbi:MAG: type I methionyl aminopeptidase [Planctomycetota bacterium]|jgi:methionyl aminopeptidase
MAITLRSRREIELMRNAGVVVAEVLLKLQEIAQPGISTEKLNSVALKVTRQAGASALFQGVKSPVARVSFPGAICASVNDEIVHGIPSKEVVLKEGDILSIDYGAKLNGYCADAAVTVAIGQVSDEKRRLINVTREMLDIAITEAAPSVRWSSIAGKMQNCAQSEGFSVVTDFVGHGIGREMHEEPKVPNFVNDELLTDDILLQEGMVIAVEPMVNMGTNKVLTLKDGWTVVTEDGKCSAHFEHTIAIVNNGCEVLTK